MNTENCNHIVGYRHGMNDARLVTQDEASDFEPNTLFAHCPKCGEKILQGGKVPDEEWLGYNVWLTFAHCPKCGEKL